MTDASINSGLERRVQGWNDFRAALLEVSSGKSPRTRLHKYLLSARDAYTKIDEMVRQPPDYYYTQGFGFAVWAMAKHTQEAKFDNSDDIDATYAVGEDGMLLRGEESFLYGYRPDCGAFECDVCGEETVVECMECLHPVAIVHVCSEQCKETLMEEVSCRLETMDWLPFPSEFPVETSDIVRHIMGRETWGLMDEYNYQSNLRRLVAKVRTRFVKRGTR